ncbi:nucleoporin complex subunit 54-domain-containing protein [Lactarius quietus]|nr:nucleoporin complex subunit 54-domain-containing protein [Lactarius quietus]
MFGGLASGTNPGPSTGTAGNQLSLFGSTQPGTTQGQGTSPGLFGGTNTGTQQTGGGPFGSNTTPAGTAQNPGQPSTGLFGGANPGTQQTGGGLFGSNAAPAGTQNPGQTGGTLFGGGQAQNQPQASGGLFGSTMQQNQPQGGGGLFGGGGNTQPPAGGGLFGNTTGTGGAQPATGGLFGSNAAANQGAPGTGGANIFGGQQQPTASGGLFGNTGASTTTQPTSGLFGSTTQQQPAAGGGLFAGSTTTQQQPAAGGGLFGNPAAQQQPAVGGGLFGSTMTQQQPMAGGGLFGSSTTQQGQPSGSGTLFGSSTMPGSSLFGTSDTGTTGAGGASFLIGGQMSQPPTTGLLGSSTLGTGSLFPTKISSVAPQNQTDAQTQFAQLQQRIEAIVGAWSPTSPLNRFQHYFYNFVDSSQVHQYGRPANAADESLWQKAVRENPDPAHLVPVLATSFDDLQKRVEAQAQQATAQQERLKEIRARIEKASERHVLSNAPRLQKLASAQAQLTHRLLRLVQHLHLLIPALRSSSIRPEEEALRAALEEIDGEIRRPGGMGRIIGKLNELWALVGAVNATRGANSKGSTDGVEWAVVDEEGLNQIVQILGEQQAGLTHLTRIIRRDLRDIGVIYGEDDGPQGGVDSSRSAI